MEHYLQLLFSKLKTTVIFIDAACKPTHKYLKDKAEQEAGHLRNRALIAVHFFVVLIFIIDLIQKKGAVLPNLIGIITCVIIVTFLLISCRYHPEVFNIFYNILIAVYGPHLTHTGGEEGLHTAWLSSFTFPTFVVLATGSLKHYVLHCLCQLFYINTFYQKVMEKHIEFATPQAFVRTLTYASNQAMILNGLFVGAITCFLHNAYQRISIVEQKKEESERQKTFLLGFSHELRNLINSLMGNVKLATLENLSPRIKDLMLNAEVCGELLLHLINNILDTGKVEIGDLEINPTPIRLYDILERVWGVCSELIKRKDIRGKMKVSKNIPTWLKLDHYRLTQIFLNLVGNAIKFTDRGGSIDITVDWIEDTEQVSKKCFEPLPFNDENDQEEGIFEKSQALSVLNDSLHCLNFTHRKISRDIPSTSSKASKGILKLIVTDTGCGISKADIEKLFQKFTQVTNDVSKRNLGTGLGLFITKELCTRMKGEVKAYSKKGKGSSFICCIPVEPVEEKATSMDMESVKNLIMSKNLKSMIVDDVQFSHVILKDFFQKLGVQVMDVAENGLEAYQKFRDHKSKRNEIHIVTMDLYMPIMDGKEAARKIREYEVNNGIDPCLLIIVSGNCAESEISECVDANGKIRANAFLKKPASIDELLRVIANYILEWNIKHPTQTELTL